MLDSILAQNGAEVTFTEIAVCTGVSLLLGLIIAAVYMFRSTYSKNFVITLALLPVMVQSVIMVVNGNLGTGVAVAGAFGLVRFRSAPGNAREITGIFFAMVVGLAAGMGYLVYSGIFTITVSAIMLLYSVLRFGERDSAVKSLRIVIPEDMDYVHAFDDIFKDYTHEFYLEKARTTNLGGLFELKYTVTMKNIEDEKHFLDKLRQRNGNLSIVCGRVVSAKDEL